jgi:hypothetical protein
MQFQLGSGTGLVGIFCSLLGNYFTLPPHQIGASVIMTDLKDILPTIEQNILHNLTSSQEPQAEVNGFRKSNVLQMPIIAELEWYNKQFSRSFSGEKMSQNLRNCILNLSTLSSHQVAYIHVSMVTYRCRI